MGVERRVFTAGKSKSQLDPFRPLKEEDVARQKLREGGRKSGKGGQSTKTPLSAIRDQLKTKVRRTEKKVKFQDKWC